jgi:galactokinase
VGVVVHAAADLTPAALRERFRRLHGGEPVLFRAPGRVNLIGEHTDYNDGFVMPAAIDRHTWVAAAPRDDRRVAIRSENLADSVTLDLDDPDPRPRRHWSDLPRGVTTTLERAGHRLRGASLLVQGDLPLGSGLGSSAAFEVATAGALLHLAGVTLDPLEVARLCQQAEHEFAGTRCGIMDQLASCRGREGRAILLDCRSLVVREVPLPPRLRVVVSDSMVRRRLAESGYNRRRAECEEAVRILAAALPHVRALRDVTPADLERERARLSDALYRRCRHVISENRRVLETAEALERADLDAVGASMAASHESLRTDYEVSCPELDLLVETARSLPGVVGARMTGAGFGGSTVNLVHEDAVPQFTRALAERYRRATGLEPGIHVVRATGGAGPVT